MNRIMRCFLHVLLLLLAADQFAQGNPAPKIVVVPNYSMEVTDITVVQHGPLVTISGHVRRSDPWTETAWGYLEISLLDGNGSLLSRTATEYSPRPIERAFHSAYQPQSTFSVTFNSAKGSVRGVKIAYRDGPLSHLASDGAER